MMPRRERKRTFAEATSSKTSKTAGRNPYVDAGARHVVLRVADEDHDRGLETAAAAIRLPAAARSR